HIVVDPPDKEGRLAILKIHARDVPLADDVDLAVTAGRTPGFAGADLANLVNEAALLAARDDRDKVGSEHFSKAIDRVVAGLEKKKRLLNEDDKRRVAYHEVGHALAGILAGSDEHVHKISIVPRRFGALGFTMQNANDERQLMTKASIMAKMVGLLGGRAAEEVVFGEPSTGAQNDLQRATEMARSMIIDYGMSEKVGPVALNPSRKPAFIPDSPGGGKGHREIGDHLADLIDEETRRIVEEGLDKARTLLASNRPLLDRVAKRLIETEVLEGEELDRLLSEARPPSTIPGALSN
ncbi:MAG: cell division protein FtsH, partial [Myxococcales bacterium]|nr:cell division protein FtsH [Myxococcales bacterium]